LSIFKKIKPDDISIVDYSANKNYTLYLQDYSASKQKYRETISVYGYEGQHYHSYLRDAQTQRVLRSGHEFISGSSLPGMENTTNGIPKRSVHDSIRHLYFGQDSIGWTHHPDQSFCVEPTRNEFRELNNNVQIISIPQQMMGDQILAANPNKFSIKIWSGSEVALAGDVEPKRLRDDGFGNIYDENAGGFSNPLSIFRSMTGSIVAKWGFNEFYPYHDYDHAASNPHPHHFDAFPWKFRDLSRYDTPTHGARVFFDSESKHGTGIKLTGAVGTMGDSNRWSYVVAQNHDNIDFRKDEDFAISLWAYLPEYQKDTTGYHNYILSKGPGEHTENGPGSDQYHVGNYPFDIVVYNQTVNVKEGFNWSFFKDITGCTYAATTMSIRNDATHSYITSSINVDLTGSYNAVHKYNSASYGHSDGQETVATSNLGGPQNASASFFIGTTADNTIEFRLTGSISNNVTASVMFNINAQSAGHVTNGTSSFIQLISYDGTTKKYILSGSHTTNAAATGSNVQVKVDPSSVTAQLAASITSSAGHTLTRFSCSTHGNNLSIFNTIAGANGNRTVTTGSNFIPAASRNWIGNGKPNLAGGSDAALEILQNNTNTIFIHTASSAPIGVDGTTGGTNRSNFTKLIVKHINNSSSLAQYQSKFGAISASYDPGNTSTQGSKLILHSMRSQSVLTYPYPSLYGEGQGGNRFSFNNITEGSSTTASYGTAASFSGGTGGGGPHGSTCPSESQVLTVKDKQGTTVNFYYTTASIAHTQLTYPTISLHGGITASADLIASASCNVINKSVEFAWTASGNTFPLLISSSYEIIADGTHGANLILTSSIAGHNQKDAIDPLGRMATVLAGDDNVNTNTGNIFANQGEMYQNTLTGSIGPEYYSDNFTQSWFVLTTRGPDFAGPTQPYTDQTGSYERHLFWFSRSGSYSEVPKLGSFTTQSGTMIDLSQTQSRNYGAGVNQAHSQSITFMSGAYDYLRITSMSMVAVDHHPSFSLSGSGDPNVNITRQINGRAGSTFETNIVPPGFSSATSAYQKNNWASSSWFVQPNSQSVVHTENGQFTAFAHDHGNPPAMLSGSQFNYAIGPLFSSSAIPTVGWDLVSTNNNAIEMTQTDGVIGTSGQILARRNDGYQTYAVSSSTLVTGSWMHILYQKSSSTTDSQIQLYINGVCECSRSQIDVGNPKNDSDYFIGIASRLTTSGDFILANDGSYITNPNTGNPAREMVREFMQPVSGAFDEFQIHDKALEQEEIDFLYRLPNGTPYVGNAFYEHGIIAITHPSGGYENIAQHCTLSFKNTHVITENEYTLNVKRGEYNFTMNPSIIEKTATGSRDKKIAPYVSETDWHPYITTIGLYNEEGQLLVVGKLSKPLKKDKGFDTTLVVQFDT